MPEPSSAARDEGAPAAYEKPEGHLFEPIMDENGVMMMWCPTCDGPAPGCTARGLDLGWLSLPGAW